MVLGLAWTAMGGSTLYIEAVCKLSTVSPGPPTLQLTGHLGEVMVESAKIAHTYARNFFKTVSNENENTFFDKNSIHLHVPEGATPKDGPSAGVTMVTA
ncbi:S16 family serine protease, partial [Salmonella sp. s51228]|uniref:S16 family serine protease n=1 Tax=Salmonella sp. s51228 TaxID=3159652 RepID=UPI00397F9DE8